MSVSSTLPAQNATFDFSKFDIHARTVAAVTEGEPEGNPSGVMVDADEAAHGLYALLKNCGTGVLRDHANLQVALASHGHLSTSLAYEPLVRGTAGMAGLIGSSVLVGPFAVFAMHAGLGEWREGPKKAAAFDASKRILEAERDFARSLARKSGSKISTELAAFDAAAAARLARNACSANGAARGAAIGKYSFLSGAAILGRVFFELVRNVGGALDTGTTDVHGARKKGELDTPFLTSTGIAANACGCLAGVFALALGINFVRKSGYFAEKWKTDAPHVAAKVKHLRDGDSEYGRFLTAKSADRAKFARRFATKNRLFAAGAGLYAAGTVLPTCVKLFAAIGVLDSKKVGSDLILALFGTAIGGAVLMGLFSHQFFVGHPKLERYEQYGYKDTPELDERFLSSIDEFAFRDPSGKNLGGAHAATRGVAMREALFAALRRCDETRDAFLRETAKALGREFVSRTHIGDERHVPYSLSERLRARFGRDRLKTDDLAAWMKSAPNRERTVEIVRRIVGEKLAYLEKKTALQRSMHQEIVRRAVAGDANAGAHDAGRAATFAERAHGSLKNADEFLKANRVLASDLRGASNAAEAEKAFDTFLDLHGEKDDEDDTSSEKAPEPIEKRLAEHFLEYMPARYAADRGRLLEIEAQAGKHLAPQHAIERPVLR